MRLGEGKWYFVTKNFLTYCEKNCSGDPENFLGSVEQFVQTLKGQNNFW
jgi:hypothetical protein